jgi:hypothetical protein
MASLETLCTTNQLFTSTNWSNTPMQGLLHKRGYGFEVLMFYFFYCCVSDMYCVGSLMTSMKATQSSSTTKFCTTRTRMTKSIPNLPADK